MKKFSYLLFLAFISCNAEKDPFQIYLEQGNDFLSKNDYENAIANFNAALAEQPDSFPALMGLTKGMLQKCILTEEECHQAEDQFSATMSRHPNRAAFIETEISAFLDATASAQ